MSTPKLTAALKVSSTLQQRITDTLSLRYQMFTSFNVLTRLRQEQRTKNLGVQGVQSFVGTPIISEELISDNTFLSSNEAVRMK